MDSGTQPGSLPGAGSPAPGWYPDPSGAEQERWWDGELWGAQTRPVSVLARPLPPTVLKNTPATVGFALGVLALLVNTFLVVSLAAFVLSALGIARAGQFVSAGYAPVGRGRAIEGIVLSLLGGAGTVLFKALLF